MANALLQSYVVKVVRRATSDYIGRPWEWDNFVDLTDRASHPCGIFQGPLLSVFGKLSTDPDGRELFEAELKGLDLLQTAANVKRPKPVGVGVHPIRRHTCLLLTEGLPGRQSHSRSSGDWRAIGKTLAALHHTRGHQFGLADFNGYFGPLLQDNRPVASVRWVDFYVERRLSPRLRNAVDSGYLPTTLASGIERILRRLPALSGPEPQPTLLHGDPQPNNFVSTDAGTFVVDTAPYFGHPEADLALVDWIDPVPRDLFDGYREVMSIDSGYPARRELWRLHAYLAAVAVVGNEDLGRRSLKEISNAIGAFQ